MWWLPGPRLGRDSLDANCQGVLEKGFPLKRPGLFFLSSAFRTTVVRPQNQKTPNRRARHIVQMVSYNVSCAESFVSYCWINQQPTNFWIFCMTWLNCAYITQVSIHLPKDSHLFPHRNVSKRLAAASGHPKKQHDRPHIPNVLANLPNKPH